MKNFLDYDLFVFDVDGTLLDTSEGLINSTVFTIKSLGLRMPDAQTLRSFVGPRIQDSMSQVFGLQGQELKKACDVFRNYYKQGDVLLAKPYPYVFELLDMLFKNKKKLAVATNKRQDFVDALMGKYGFAKYFTVVHGTDFEGKLKKSDLIQKCLEDFTIQNLRNAVMIGDSEYDFDAAKECGVDFIGVTYGFGYKKNTSLPSGEACLLESLKDICNS